MPVRAEYSPSEPRSLAGQGPGYSGAIFGALCVPTSRRLALGLPEPERASPGEEAEAVLKTTLGQKF